MKKIILLLLTVTILSFQTQEKKVKFEFTVQETELIYNALGELPAKQVEGLRAKIALEYQKQIIDTIKKK